MQNNENKSITTSFYMTPADREQLKFLQAEFGLNGSALMRQLICSLYAARKQDRARFLKAGSRA